MNLIIFFGALSGKLHFIFAEILLLEKRDEIGQFCFSIATHIC